MSIGNACVLERIWPLTMAEAVSEMLVFPIAAADELVKTTVTGTAELVGVTVVGETVQLVPAGHVQASAIGRLNEFKGVRTPEKDCESPRRTVAVWFPD